MIILDSFSLTTSLCLDLYPFYGGYSLWHACSEVQRHILKDRRPSTAACPLAGRWVQRKWIVFSEEKIFFFFAYFALGRLEQPRQNKTLLCRHDKSNKPTKEGPPFHLYSVSPHSPQFQQSAWATSLYSLSGESFRDLHVSCKEISYSTVSLQGPEPQTQRATQFSHSLRQKRPQRGR